MHAYINKNNSKEHILPVFQNKQAQICREVDKIILKRSALGAKIYQVLNLSQF